jgi:hypothetical protein
MIPHSLTFDKTTDHTTQCHNKYKYSVLNKTQSSYGYKHVG